MDETLMLYILAAVLTTIAFIYLYRESRERQKAIKKEEEKLKKH